MFGRAQFVGDAAFLDAQFTGDARFIGTQFGGDTWFVGAKFGATAQFEAQFGGGGMFGRAQFATALDQLGEEPGSATIAAFLPRVQKAVVQMISVRGM